MPLECEHASHEAKDRRFSCASCRVRYWKAQRRGIAAWQRWLEDNPIPHRGPKTNDSNESE